MKPGTVNTTDVESGTDSGVNSDSKLQSRTVFFSSTHAPISTSAQIYEQILNKFKTEVSSFAETVTEMSNVAFKDLSSYHPLGAAEWAKSSIDEEKKLILKKINEGSFVVKTSNFSDRHRITGMQGAAAASAFNTAFDKFVSRFNGIKTSISCEDLEELSDIANAFVPKSEADAKSVEESGRVQGLMMKLLLFAISQSNSTLTNSANMIIEAFEKYLTSAPLSLLQNPKHLALYTRVFSQYLNLAVGGSISSSSISKAIVLHAQTNISQANVNIDVLAKTKMPLERHHQVLDAYADLARTAFGISAKSKGGLFASEQIKQALALIFKSGTKTIVANENADVSSELKGIFALGNSITANMAVEARKLNTNLKIAEDREKVLYGDTARALDRLAAEVDLKGSRFLGMIINFRYAPAPDARRMHLCESQYAKLSAVLSSIAPGHLANNDAAGLSHLLRKMALLRHQICESDTIVAPNAITSVRNKPVRSIYGINETAIDTVEKSILEVLEKKSPSATETSYLIDCLTFISQIRYGKHRNRPGMGVFVQSNEKFKSQVNKLLEITKSTNSTVRGVIHAFINRLYTRLNDFEHSDVTTSSDAMLLSSKELMCLGIARAQKSMQTRLASGEKLENIVLEREELQRLLGSYINEFFAGRDGMSALASELISKVSTTGTVGIQPLELTSRMVIKSYMSEYIKLNPGSETPARSQLASDLDNSLLKDLMIVKKSMDDSNFAVNKVEINAKVKEAIAHALKRFEQSSASKASMATQNNVALCYLACKLNGDDARANAYMNIFQKMEHQPTQMCVSKHDLQKILDDLS